MVIKRDGAKQFYDRQKIKKAMLLAFAKREFVPEDLDAMIAALESKWSG